MFRLGHVQPEEVVRDGRGGDFSTPWLLGDGITLRICTTDIFRDGIIKPRPKANGGACLLTWAFSAVFQGSARYR